MDIENIKEGINKIKEGMSILSKGPMDYYLKGLMECREELFKRCCPFQIGDEVELIVDLKIEKSSGWYSCRHFLIVNAKATVREVDFYRGGFKFELEFYNESFIDFHGDEHPIINRHIFVFDENKLRLVRGDIEPAIVKN